MTTVQATTDVFEAVVPEGEKITLWVKEDDGTHGEVELQDLIPALLKMGSEHPRAEKTSQDVSIEDGADASEEPEKGEAEESDFGYFVVPDGTVFTRDGKTIELQEAMGYLERGIVESIRFAVERDSDDAQYRERFRESGAGIAWDLSNALPVTSAGTWGFFCVLCGAETGEVEPEASLKEHEAHRRSEAWHHAECVWVRAKRFAGGSAQEKVAALDEALDGAEKEFGPLSGPEREEAEAMLHPEEGAMSDSADSLEAGYAELAAQKESEDAGRKSRRRR